MYAGAPTPPAAPRRLAPARAARGLHPATHDAPVTTPVPPARRAAPSLVAPLFLLPILAEAARHGLGTEVLFRGLEIDAGDFELPGTVISHQEAITVVRRALLRLPIAGRGIELGQRARITERGALALGLLAAPTLGAAISLAVRFAQSAGYLLAVREQAVAAGHQLVVEPYPGDQDLQRFLVELTFSAVVQLRRQVTLSNYAPLEVRFVHPAPHRPAEHAGYFGCPVVYGCLDNALLTARDVLAWPLPWANAMAGRLAAQLLDREAARFDSMSALGFTVARVIRRSLPGTPDLAQVAASLNLSERTLRRQLAQQGLSYRQLLDEGRRSRALDLMTSGYRPINEVAAAVGFADARAFGRAFKRWTGHPPSRLRASVADGWPAAPPDGDGDGDSDGGG